MEKEIETNRRGIERRGEGRDREREEGSQKEASGPQEMERPLATQSSIPSRRQSPSFVLTWPVGLQPCDPEHWTSQIL